MIEGRSVKKLFCLILLFQFGCALQPPSLNYEKTLTNNPLGPGVMDRDQVRFQIAELEKQIASYETLILRTQSRILSYQNQIIPGKEGRVAAEQAELTSYQEKKIGLQARRQQLLEM